MTSNDELDNQATAHSIEHLIVWPIVMLFILAYVEAVCYLGFRDVSA